MSTPSLFLAVPVSTVSRKNVVCAPTPDTFGPTYMQLFKPKPPLSVLAGGCIGRSPRVALALAGVTMAHTSIAGLVCAKTAPGATPHVTVAATAILLQ